MINSFSGCMIFQTTTFSLISSEVYDDDGFASLLLDFNVSDVVTLKLYGPNADMLLSEIFYRGTSHTSVSLTSHQTNPLPGTYILNAYDKNNKNIFRKEFLFEGKNLSISNVVEKWSNEKVWSDEYSLVGLNITVTNHGDLPAYIYKANVVIDSEISSALLLPNVILPKHSGTICCFVYIKDISSEEHVLKLSLENSKGDILANTSYSTTPIENVSNLEYKWRYNVMNYISLPDPKCLYEYYSNSDRLILEDYAAYVFDIYDDLYLDMVVEKFLYLFDTLADVATINAVASFIQDMQYVEDDPEDPDCEYPRYPIEMLKDEKGDCEDKAILTAAILDRMGYNVSLLLLPNHMAVGVNLDEEASTYDYYIKEYYYLETTRTNWILGRVPSEYSDISDVTVYPISPRSILTHSWKNATRYTSSDGNDFVKMKIIVKNLGRNEAKNIKINGAFFADYGMSYNQEVAMISSLSAGEKQEVKLEIEVPQGISTILKTHIYLNNKMVDEKESTSSF